MSALLVALEGLPGAGKTTVAEMVAKELESQGYRVEIVDAHANDAQAFTLRETMRAYPIGHPVRTALCWALRARQSSKASRLSGQTDIILLDRYWGSTTAFDSYGNSVPREVMDWLASYAGCKPNITLFFSVPLGLACQRKKADTMSDLGLSRRVELGFRNLAAEFGWIRINASRAPEEVKKACMLAITAKLPQK